jgi:hypothetical protein
MPQFPELNLSLYLQGVGIVLTALATVWAVRKVIKLINRS